MSEARTTLFAVSATPHQWFGRQIRLRFGDGDELRLTSAEASSLAFALIAVRAGISPEREIYMSPIASDVAFVGCVSDDGISIQLPGAMPVLTWDEVGLLADQLARQVDIKD